MQFFELPDCDDNSARDVIRDGNQATFRRHWSAEIFSPVVTRCDLGKRVSPRLALSGVSERRCYLHSSDEEGLKSCSECSDGQELMLFECFL